MKLIEDMLQSAKEKNQKLKDFSDLIDSIESIDDKRKFLWKEIYSNAVSDRENAYALFINLYQSMTGAPSEHLTAGSMLNKYLERMGKSNEQLLKLAEIIKSSSENAEIVTPEEIFNKISG